MRNSLLAMAIALAGVSGTGWTKPVAPTADFQRAAHQCRTADNALRGSRGTITLDMDFYHDCLRARGWRHVTN